MKHLLCLAILFLLVISPFNTIKFAAAENTCTNIIQPTVFFSEIGWAGSSKSTVDEWLEIANASDDVVDISGWTIEGAATSGGKLTLPNGSQLLPRAVYLIANYSAESSSSVLNSPPNYVTTSVSLSNSSLSLNLKNQDGCLIDSAGSGAPFFGGTSTAGTISMARLQPISDGTISISWTAAESSNGFDSGAPDLGTPGVVEWVESGAVSEATPFDSAQGLQEAAEATEATNATEASEATADTSVDEPITNETSLSVTTSAEQNNKPTAGSFSEAENSLSGLAGNEGIEGTEEMEGIEGNEAATPFDSAQGLREVAGATEAPEASEAAIVEEAYSTSGVSETVTSETIETIAAEEATTAEDISETTSSSEETTATEATEAPEAAEAATESSATFLAEPSPVSYLPGALLINEFVSDPVSGEKEWVEIINPSNEIVSLTGWKISEGSGRKISLPDINLYFGQTAVAEFSSGALNNDGDAIILLDPNEEIIDQIQYGNEEIPAASDPNSVARKTDGEFVITTTPTRGLGNVITTVESLEESEEVTEAAEATFEAAPFDQAAPGLREATETNEMDDESEVVIEETGETTTASTIRLSELYPNTDGSDETDEFIELENYGSADIDIFGVKLEDATGNDWTCSDHTILVAQSFLAIGRPTFQFALNNSGSETVRLYAADGNLLDETQYENAPKKFVYARDRDTWRWANEPTPNEPNVFSETLESENSGMAEAERVTVASERTSQTKSPARVSLAEARAAGSDNKVIVEGVVAVKPGVLSSQIFYLLDGTSGMQIYKSDANFPEIEIGDRLEISGTISSNRGEPRIKIGKDDTITVLEQNVPIATIDITVVEEKLAGQLVRTTGTVTEKSSGQLTIENEAGLVDIKVKDGTNIDLSEIKPGDKITVTGLVGQTETAFYLLPRSSEDIEKIPIENSALVSGISDEPTGKTTAANHNQRNALIIGSGIILGLIVYTLRGQWQKKKKLYEKNRKLSLVPTG
ncbi:MAG: lamin tail domain-containing protein [Candidatus Uhrbacteria bacterium]